MELNQIKKQNYGLDTRFKPGEECVNAILTENDVREIRVNYSNGMTVKQICSYTGMSENAIRCIVKYKTWKYVK